MCTIQQSRVTIDGALHQLVLHFIFKFQVCSCATRFTRAGPEGGACLYHWTFSVVVSPAHLVTYQLHAGQRQYWHNAGQPALQGGLLVTQQRQLPFSITLPESLAGSCFESHCRCRAGLSGESDWIRGRGTSYDGQCGGHSKATAVLVQNATTDISLPALVDQPKLL